MEKENNETLYGFDESDRLAHIETEEKKDDDIYKMKLGEILNHDLLNGLLVAPIKCVAISVTLLDKDGTQMTSTLKHEDYKEEDDD